MRILLAALSLSGNLTGLATRNRHLLWWPFESSGRLFVVDFFSIENFSLDSSILGEIVTYT